MNKNITLPVIFAVLLFASCKKTDCYECTARPINSVYGGSMNEGASKIIATTDKGYLFTGWTYSNNGQVTGFHGQQDAWIVKLDCTGKIQWQKAVGGSSSDGAYSVTPASDGGYVFAGLSYSNDGDVSGNHGSGDLWVFKLDLNGNLIWSKSYGGTGIESANDIAPASDGGYVLTGSTTSNNGDVVGFHGNYDIWTIKIDKNGNKIWQRALGGTAYESGANVAATPDGGFIVSGSATSTNGDLTGPNRGSDDAWLIKLNGAGNIVWQKTYGGSKTDDFNGIAVNADETFVVVGITVSNDGDVVGKFPGTTNVGTPTTDAWVVKLSKTGNIIWQRTVGEPNIDYQGRDIVTVADGGYALAGAVPSGNKIPNDQAMVAKLNSSGIVQWQRSFGGSAGEGFSSIISVGALGFIMSGGTTSNDGDISGNHGTQDAWIFTTRD